ncbi:MAG: hypothetical protein NC904_07235, partial [Candidatus Omnitrophica bacterium]|nr:hypothetical protein [Candidatus Omnitrophota bacterium]
MREDTEDKLRILGSLSVFDTTGIPRSLNFGYNRYKNFIYPAVGFKGKICNLFKVLQTNRCQYNCYYCVNRCARDTPRLSFKPNELAQLFLHFYKKRWVEGLFLSSGIFPNPNKAQESMFQTIKLVREAGFKGYIHTVILPGVDDYLITELGKLS